MSSRSGGHGGQFLREKAIAYTVLAVFLFYSLLPMFYLVVSATKTNTQLFSTFGLWFAGDINLLTNIRALFAHQDGVFSRWLFNSALYSLAGGFGAAAVATAEFLVLVGPSGCGKSTALRMIAGLETITGGTMKIGDRVVNDVEPKDRDIAMVFQNYALYPHMSVYDNIGFALKLAQVPKDEIDTRVRKAARDPRTRGEPRSQARQLSGGQRQRVAMGRAIVRQPAAFLMDEPLSNLDAKLRVQMRAEIAALQRELGRHHRVRHPRPDRGDDDGRPRRSR
jgi:ABC-type thiamine transport system ATPase subunit